MADMLSRTRFMARDIAMSACALVVAPVAGALIGAFAATVTAAMISYYALTENESEKLKE